MRMTWLALLVMTVASPATAVAQLPQKPVLTLAAAKQAAAAAEAVALQNRWNVVIAIVDDGGHLVHLQRLDDTQHASIEIALQKARSSAAFRRATKGFADRLAEGAVALMALPGVMPVEGGVPLVVGGKVVGAIGVSGVTSQQDGVIAQAGADAVAALQVGQR